MLSMTLIHTSYENCDVLLPVGHFLFVVYVNVYIVHAHVLEFQFVRGFVLSMNLLKLY